MMDREQNGEPESGWRIITGDQLENLPPELRSRIEEELNRQPIAEVTVRVFEARVGGSEVRIGTTLDGAFAGTHSADEELRQETYNALVELVAEELRNAARIFGDG